MRLYATRLRVLDSSFVPPDEALRDVPRELRAT
jgi:hypothetical protein